MSTEAELITRLEAEGSEAVRLKIQAGLIERSELERAVQWLIDKDAAAAQGTPRPIFMMNSCVMGLFTVTTYSFS